MPTLGDHLDDRDAATFVGRRPELALVDDLLAGRIAARILYVRGPGGIGKSSLLRIAGRRAADLGRPVVRLDGRSLGTGGIALDALAAAIDRDQPVLLLVDSWESATGLDEHLRHHVLRGLHADSVAIIASRRAPEPGWSDGGWDRLRHDLTLGPLHPDEAEAYVELLGVEARNRDDLLSWAEGSPLALTLGALQREPGGEDQGDELIDRLIHRLIGEELSPESVAALEVASIARVATTDVLAATIPTDPRGAMDELAACTFSERLEDGVTLHALVGTAIRTQLRHRNPTRDRALRAALADHAFRRALAAGASMSADLAHLVESESVRWGFSWDPNGQYRLDHARAGDAEVIGLLMQPLHDAEEWGPRRPYLDEQPERVLVARDSAGGIGGYAIVVAAADAPACAHADPFLRPWLEHAHAGPAPERTVMWRNSSDLTPQRDGSLHALFGFAGVLWSGVANPRFAYLPIAADFEDAKRFSEAIGGVHVPSLDQVVAGQVIECHIVDYGDGGVLAAQLRQVHLELGVPATASPGGADLEVVREALKALTNPERLAATPFAVGPTVDDRARHVRRVLSEGMDRAFGPSEPEQELRQVLERAYLFPAGGHDAAARDLSLSRPVYFRRLREATARLAAHLDAPLHHGRPDDSPHDDLNAYLANHDPLTGLLNRRGIEVAMAKVDGPFAVALLDLDRFKTVNDTVGHDGGDAVLRAMAALLSDVREDDLVCRWGGDELVVVFAGGDLENAHGWLERKLVESRQTIIAGDIAVTFSAGLAASDGRDFARCVAEADARMYAAKQRGRAQVRATSD